MNRERVRLQPAYILHHHPYRNSSRLLEVFTRDHGRFGMVARGVGSRRSRLQGRLQPFRPLLLSWSGRGELMTLTAAESDGLPLPLSGAALLGGFYLNELLLRLTGRHLPTPDLFALYHETLCRLGEGGLDEGVLRSFECRLLEELGYRMVLDHDVESGAPIQPDRCYCYHIEKGPVEVAEDGGGELRLSGSTLLALARGRFPDAASLREARRLMRRVLAFYLGDKPLRSRQLFRALEKRSQGEPMP